MPEKYPYSPRVSPTVSSERQMLLLLCQRRFINSDKIHHCAVEYQ
jgi:hypothetical protein